MGQDESAYARGKYSFLSFAVFLASYQTSTIRSARSLFLLDFFFCPPACPLVGSTQRCRISARSAGTSLGGRGGQFEG